jgi:hypothetical protein
MLIVSLPQSTSPRYAHPKRLLAGFWISMLIAIAAVIRRPRISRQIAHG